MFDRGAVLLFCLSALAGCGVPKPGPFYETPAAKAPAGTLISTAPFAPVNGATAYRILYNSTDIDGRTIAVSGVVYVPTAPPPPGGRNVVAWAHATTGIAPGCAPSLAGGAAMAASVPGLDGFISAGDVVTATDYPGLGVPGVHPYLIGRSEGAAILDSVRAAGQLPGAALGRKFVVWGHSQGAQAALFAGQMAHGYAPELTLVGVAAAAPVTDLNGELTEPFTGNAGRLLAAYVYYSWSRAYHVPITSVVYPQAVPAVNKTAAQCINNLGEGIAAVLSAGALNPVFLSAPPATTAPWPALFKENSPGHSAPGAALLIVQGSRDPTVEPHWTRSFAKLVCSRHEPIAYVEFRGARHLDIAETSLPVVTAWIRDRFAGRKPPDNCPG